VQNGGGSGEVDMDAPETPSAVVQGDITLGISLESSESVSAQMAALQSSQTQPTNPSSALVVTPRPGTEIRKQPDTLLLAQRIIKNAFNFLASFSGNINGGVEVVPLKAFEEWWRKFEGRVRNDPGFLERDGD
jgi:protein Hikeshi